MGKKSKLNLVVRLSTSFFWRKDSSAISSDKTIRLLKSKSTGSLRDLINDPALDFPMITNINECDDGIYVLETCNESYDIELGIIDDYDFYLKPYVEEDDA